MKYYSLFCLLLVVANIGHTKTVQYHRPMDFIQEIKNDPDKGAKVYDKICATCHAPQPVIEAGAPHAHNEADWKERRKKGLKGLLKNLENNLGIMPARGGCFECSDAELMAAIEYMLPHKKEKLD